MLKRQVRRTMGLFYFLLVLACLTGLTALPGRAVRTAAAEAGQNSQGQIASAATAGWKEVNGKYYYYKANGKVLKKKGLQKLEGKYYFLNKNYTRYSGLKKIKGKYYYFQKTDGSMVTAKGWFTEGGTIYVTKKHNLITGVRKISGKWYLFSKKGILQKNHGVFTYKGKQYTTDENGICHKYVEPEPEPDPEPSESRTVKECREEAWRFINRHSSSSASSYSRLTSCFNWLTAYHGWRYRGPSYYKDLSDNFTNEDWPYIFALEDFERGCIGDCFGFACIMAVVANELGYTSTVVLTTGDHAFAIVNGRYYGTMRGEGEDGKSTTHSAYNVWHKSTLY